MGTPPASGPLLHASAHSMSISITGECLLRDASNIPAHFGNASLPTANSIPKMLAIKVHLALYLFPTKSRARITRTQVLCSLIRSTIPGSFPPRAFWQRPFHSPHAPPLSLTGFPRPATTFRTAGQTPLGDIKSCIDQRPLKRARTASAVTSPPARNKPLWSKFRPLRVKYHRFALSSSQSLLQLKQCSFGTRSH